MKLKIFLVVVGLLHICALSAQVNPQSHYVNGYVRKNGTYVQPHHRTNPNSTINDNYTTYPNVNPYTGTQGRIKPQSYSAPKVNYYTPTYPRIPSNSAPRVYRSRAY